MMNKGVVGVGWWETVPQQMVQGLWTICFMHPALPSRPLSPSLSLVLSLPSALLSPSLSSLPLSP